MQHKMANDIKGIITVLGSPNDKSGKLYSIAIERCNEAVKLYKSNPGWKIVLTGGYGGHFNTTERPHAFYLKQYLVEHGIPENDILEFVESSNTLEDASLLKPIIIRYAIAFVVVITSDFHVERARYIFEREFSNNEVRPFFVATETDESKCKLDLNALKQHERKALLKLIEN